MNPRAPILFDRSTGHLDGSPAWSSGVAESGIPSQLEG